MSESNEVLTKLRDFCSKYFKSRPSAKEKTELTQDLNRYMATVCVRFCQLLNTLLDREPNVVNISGQSYVFGDIHGNLEDMYDYEDMYWNNDNIADRNTSFVFLGDFVDRGLFSVEVSLYLLALKHSNPKRFILVRGNHEVRVVNKGYTFFNECVTKFGQQLGNEIWDQINKCFERLPLAAIIDNQVFCCHGGVPKSITTVDEMQRIQKPLVDPSIESPGAHELLWNDPIESMATFNIMTERLLRQKRIEFVPNKTRSTGYYFTSLGAKRFLDTNGFTHMIRAHECVDEGIRFTSDNRVITVFSSSNYCGKTNTTACLRITPTNITVCILKRPK